MTGTTGHASLLTVEGGGGSSSSVTGDCGDARPESESEKLCQLAAKLWRCLTRSDSLVSELQRDGRRRFEPRQLLS